MNLIWICADTFRNDYLGCLGLQNVKTPNLDALAAEGMLFENAHAEGLPTGPERAVFMTGKFMLPFRGWVPLIPEDVTLAEHLGAQGWRTALYSDCYHMFKPDCNYHRGFDEFRWIRGQEQDKYITAPKGEDPWAYMPERTQTIPPEHKKGGRKGGGDNVHSLRQYLRNVSERGEDESEYFPGQTIGGAMKWLDENRDAEKFLLWIELFDPHEPFDPPEKYYDMYHNPAYTGPKIIGPWFHSTLAEDYTEEELEHVRALYAGEVSLVDAWVGKLMAKVDELGLRDSTAVVFVSDHGTCIGERTIVGKQPTIGTGMSRYVCNQALVVRHPGGPAGSRISDLVWSPDYMPTCCEMLGVDPPDTVHGRSFWKLAAQGDRSAARDHVVSGKINRDFYLVDDTWSFLPKSNFNEDELYDRASDPYETRNLAADHPGVCDALRAKVQAHLDLSKTIHM
jgi:arylsulfatase A-like enzyme